MKRALCVGINSYVFSANSLYGCVNDANDMAAILKNFGFNTVVVINSGATQWNIEEKLTELALISNAGDHVVWSQSSHGTNVPDYNEDEGDGFDEAIVMYDGMWIDDDIRKALDKFKPGVHVTIIFDSCFSATATRKKTTSERRRFLKTSDIPVMAVRLRKIVPRLTNNEVFISGCKDNEYSYDAYIDGRFNGAFTYNFFYSFEDGDTYEEMYAKLRKKLPSSEYPQTPTIEGDIYKQMFKDSIVSGIEDHTSTEVPTPVVILTWLQKLWKWIKKLLGI